MKLLLLSILTTVSTLAQAQEAATEKLKITGTGRMRFEIQDFTDSLTGSANYTSIRLRPQATYKAHDQLEFVFEPQFNKRMGAEAYVGSGTAANTLTETSGNSAYAGDPVTVYQGYMNVKFDDHFSLKGGRQQLKYGDEIILGPANWGLYGRSFDAVTARFSMDKNFVDAIYGKVADFGAKTTTNMGDRDLYGVYASWNFDMPLKTAEAYWFLRDDLDKVATGGGADTTVPNRYSVYGARLVAGFGDFGITAEYAKGDGSKVFVNDGSESDMYQANVSYKIGEKHKAAVEYGHAGKNWNELYPTTNRALGRADVLGRRNLNHIAFHWTSDFSDYFGMEFDYYNFSRASTDARSYKTNGTSTWGHATDTSKAIGQEFDLALKYKQNAAVTWSAAYAMFLNGDYAKKTLEGAGLKGSRNPDFFYVMLETKF